MNKTISPITHQSLTQYTDKKNLLKQKGKVLWFTGLSGSGKSTIAIHLEKKLLDEGVLCKVLDGDNLRAGLNKNLGFTEEDRIENIRRTAEVAKLFSEIGVLVIVSFITPTQAMRDMARNIIGEEYFAEVYINSSLETCEQRDVKGLYQKARKGEILNFTGVTAVYEVPEKPDSLIETDRYSITDCVESLYSSIAKI